MKRTSRLGVALALTLTLAACGSAASEEDAAAPEEQESATQDPAADDAEDEHAAHEDHAGEEDDPHAHHRGDETEVEDPIVVNVLGRSTGEFEPADNGHGAVEDLGIEGTAVMEKTEAGTSVTVRAEGLQSNETFPAHLHDGSCTDLGGHYKQDPAGPMSPPNEIWVSSSEDPEGDLEANHQGVVNGSGSADWVPRQQPLSIQIHAPEFPGLPIVCADFAGYEDSVTMLLSADATHGAEVESIEYSIDGGETLTYEQPVELAEPGTYTVLVHGVEADGATTEPQEVQLVVGGTA